MYTLLQLAKTKILRVKVMVRGLIIAGNIQTTGQYDYTILNLSYKVFKSFVTCKPIETRGNLCTELGPPVVYRAC